MTYRDKKTDRDRTLTRKSERARKREVARGPIRGR